MGFTCRSLAALWMTIVPAILSAQTAPPAKAAAAICWRARWLAECRGWVITEMGLEIPLLSTSGTHAFGNGSSHVSDDFGGRLTLTLGGMKNIGAKSAAGLTATLSMEDPDVLLPNRIEARYRKWFLRTNGIDLSAGLARQTIRGDNERTSIRAMGLTASAGLSNTYFGLDGRVDLMYGNGRPVTAAFVGVRSASRAAPIVAASGIVLFLAAFAYLVGPIA